MWLFSVLELSFQTECEFKIPVENFQKIDFFSKFSQLFEEFQELIQAEGCPSALLTLSDVCFVIEHQFWFKSDFMTILH